jgi:hypothetical protein
VIGQVLSAGKLVPDLLNAWHEGLISQRREHSNRSSSRALLTTGAAPGFFCDYRFLRFRQWFAPKGGVVAGARAVIKTSHKIS